MKILAIAAAVALLAWMIKQIITAPEGYQDEEGFHRGKEPK